MCDGELTPEVWRSFMQWIALAESLFIDEGEMPRHQCGDARSRIFRKICCRHISA
jgi:hypothetical protein